MEAFCFHSSATFSRRCSIKDTRMFTRSPSSVLEEALLVNIFPTSIFQHFLFPVCAHSSTPSDHVGHQNTLVALRQSEVDVPSRGSTALWVSLSSSVLFRSCYLRGGGRGRGKAGARLMKTLIVSSSACFPTIIGRQKCNSAYRSLNLTLNLTTTLQMGL